MSSSMGLQALGANGCHAIRVVEKPLAYTEPELKLRGKIAQRVNPPVLVGTMGRTIETLRMSGALVSIV